MTLLPPKTPSAFAHKLASLQSRAWLPPALLLLALSTIFIFGAERRDYFYQSGMHSEISAKNMAIVENLSPEHHFLMFASRTLDTDGRHVYDVYNRFPIGNFALIKLAILPFGDDLSAKIYAARMLMLLKFAAAAVFAYLALRRLAASRWIALTATLLAFSSAYCLYYNDVISSEAAIDIFAAMLVFHGMAVFEQERRFRQLLLKTCLALLLAWHVYALLLPFIVFGLMRGFYYKTRSGVPPPSCQLKYATLSLLRSRYLTLGVVALLFGVSVLTINFTNEYFALNRETPPTELPSFKSMISRIGVDPHFSKPESPTYLAWPTFPERQFYRVGMMSWPYAFFPPFVKQRLDAPPRLLVILGIAASGASLFGLLFVRRHKILLASLTLSGFCWALPMRHNTAYPWHEFESVFYIGVTLTLFSLLLLCLRRLSSERLIAALSVAALLIFAVSALRMSQLNSANRTPELHQAVMDDFEYIRDMTDGGVILVNAMPKLYGGLAAFPYYLSGRIGIYAHETASPARTHDFVITGMRAGGLASLTPQNRMIFLYEWDAYHRYISESIERAEPLIRSAFDVYIVDNAMIYFKDACQEHDISEKFFLAIYPSVKNDLPRYRRQRGFHNLDFHFEEQAVWLGERCIAVASLPDYDIARIKTGQFIQLPDGSFQHLWEGEIHLTQ